MESPSRTIAATSRPEPNRITYSELRVNQASRRICAMPMARNWPKSRTATNTRRGSASSPSTYSHNARGVRVMRARDSPIKTLR